MEPHYYNIEEKISGIKQTLQSLGRSYSPSMNTSPQKRSLSSLEQGQFSDLMNTPDQHDDKLKPETGTGFINVIDNVEVHQSPRALKLITIDKETIAKLEDRIVQKDNLIKQMGNLQAESQKKLDGVYDKVKVLQEKQNRAVNDQHIVDAKCIALERENQELKQQITGTVSQENYKDSLRELAIIQERLQVMEKYRTEMYNENLALYAKLQEKDKEIAQQNEERIAIEDQLTSLKQKDDSREAQILMLQKERIEIMKGQDAAKRPRTAFTSRAGSTGEFVLSPRVSTRMIVKTLQSELKVRSPEKLPEVVQQFKQRLTSSSKFVNKVANLMTELHPSTKKPTLKQVWKWLRNVFEEFMKEKTKKPLNDLQMAVGMDSVSKLVEEVARLKNDNVKLSDKLNRLMKELAD